MLREKPPAARDAGMDRDRAPEGEWSLLIVPRVRGKVREFHFSALHLLLARVAVVASAVVTVAASVSLWITVPRSAAYHGLIEENLALKRDIQKVSERMAEVDRILLRLRLYDAQMKSLAEPKGDHGPVDVENILANSSFVAAYAGSPEVFDAPDGEERVLDDPGEMGVDGWAAAVSQRSDTFLTLFRVAEPELNRLLEDLEKFRAFEGAMPSTWPARGMFSSGFGWRKNPFGRRDWKFHSGLDLSGPSGTPIHAAANGVVIRSQSGYGGYGRAVEIDHGYGISTLYGHCTALLVAEGDRVERGDLIATMGSSGRSTGSHLHFEVRLDGIPVDPLDYLPRRR